MTQRNLTFLLFGLLTLTAGLNRTEAQSSAIPFADYGVWDRGSEASGFDPRNPEYDYLRGIALSPKWKDIQTDPADPDFYDWSEIQAALDLAAPLGSQSQKKFWPRAILGHRLGHQLMVFQPIWANPWSSTAIPVCTKKPHKTLGFMGFL